MPTLSINSTGLVLSGSITPVVSSSFSLGTTNNPFRDLFIQSGSLSIQSDVSGQPSTLLSNVSGNILVSAGGMQ